MWLNQEELQNLPDHLPGSKVGDRVQDQPVNQCDTLAARTIIPVACQS